jgi:hypothetical protein
VTDYTWPSTITPAASAWRLVANTGNYGQRAAPRMGDRWSCTLSLPTMRSADAMGFVGFLARLRGCAHRVVLPDHSYTKRGTAGNVLVNGASQSLALVCDGAAAGATVKVGDFLTLEDRLYMVGDDATADGSGNITLSLTVPMYVPPANNATVNLVSPTARFLLVSDVTWQFIPGGFVQFGPLEFLEDIP